MLEEPKQRLRDEGVGDDQIGMLLDAAKDEIQQMAAFYNVPLNREKPVTVVQKTLLDIIIEYGTDRESMTIPTQFKEVVEDFTNTNERASRSSMVLVIAFIATEDDAPHEIRELRDAIVSHNYQQHHNNPSPDESDRSI